MKYGYTAKALKVLALLDTSDARTFRLLIRTLPGKLRNFTPLVAAETILACAAVDVEPLVVYHRLRGHRLYRMLTAQLAQDVAALSPKMVCDVFAALARVGQREDDLKRAIEEVVDKRPFKFHLEHLVSLLRDFGVLGFRSRDLRFLACQRRHQLPECTPSALCAVPYALALHPSQSQNPKACDETERLFLAEVSKLLCTSGAYLLPSDPRAFRTKDDFWFQEMRQRHFRLRRRAKLAGVAVVPAARPPVIETALAAKDTENVEEEERSFDAAAVVPTSVNGV
jgi:hypothetical protein